MHASGGVEASFYQQSHEVVSRYFRHRYIHISEPHDRLAMPRSLMHVYIMVAEFFQGLNSNMMATW